MKFLVVTPLSIYHLLWVPLLVSGLIHIGDPESQGMVGGWGGGLLAYLVRVSDM